MPPAARSSASTGASTRSTTRKTAATRRSTQGQKAAGTRARTSASRTRSTAARRANRRASSTASRVETATRPQRNTVSDYAERAVLIPVGAALIARDRVVSTVNDVLTTYSTPSRAQTQLRKFERRGSSARKGLEREVRKTRTRFERQLRQSRREFERTVSRLDRRRGSAAKNLGSQLEQASAQVENAVQTGIKESSVIAARVQERVLNRV